MNGYKHLPVIFEGRCLKISNLSDFRIRVVVFDFESELSNPDSSMECAGHMFHIIGITSIGTNAFIVCFEFQHKLDTQIYLLQNTVDFTNFFQNFSVVHTLDGNKLLVSNLWNFAQVQGSSVTLVLGRGRAGVQLARLMHP